MDNNNNLTSQGIAALKAGNKEQAATLLYRATEHDPNNQVAWLWLAGCVDSDQDKRTCLERVIAIDPTSEPAKRARMGLTKLQDLPSVDEMMGKVKNGPILKHWLIFAGSIVLIFALYWGLKWGAHWYQFERIGSHWKSGPKYDICLECQEEILSQLKYPSEASFTIGCSRYWGPTFDPEIHEYYRETEFVDAKNDYGETINTAFWCHISYQDGEWVVRAEPLLP